jgi:hypothetical protein
LDPRFGFLLPYEIEGARQEALVRFVREKAQPSRFYDSGGAFSDPWYYFTFHRVSNVEELQEKFPGVHPPYDFKFRFEEACRWEWVDSPVTGTVCEEVARVEHLFKKLTRVQIILQRPGFELPLHRDLVTGEEYPGGQIYNPFGKSYEVREKHRHAQQDFLALKIPLTERAGDNGRPVGRRFFALNEAFLRHGALPVEHYRGVICVDGILDPERLAAEKREPIPIKNGL